MQFDVRALDRSTGVVSLVLEAVSAQAATAQAQQQGLAVLRVRPKGKAGWSLSRGGSNQAFPLGQDGKGILGIKSKQCKRGNYLPDIPYSERKIHI